MAYLWFSSPVPVWTKPTRCKHVSHVLEAAEVLLKEFPKGKGRQACLTARIACLAALEGTGDIETARSAFEAAAREAGILGK